MKVEEIEFYIIAEPVEYLNLKLDLEGCGFSSTSFLRIDPVILEPSELLEISESSGGLNVKKGTLGCSRAHMQAWDNVSKQRKEGIRGALILEADAILTDYGRHFLRECLLSVSEDMHLLQLGSLSSTSGRVGQRINFVNNLRNTFGSDLVHDLKEDILQALKSPIRYVNGYRGGTHAYYVSTTAAKAFASRPLDHFVALDDLFKAMALSNKWIYRTRQNLFVQNDTTSLIDFHGR